jgi:hypothetical protein
VGVGVRVCVCVCVGGRDLGATATGSAQDSVGRPPRLVRSLEVRALLAECDLDRRGAPSDEVRELPLADALEALVHLKWGRGWAWCIGAQNLSHPFPPPSHAHTPPPCLPASGPLRPG